MKGLIFTYPRKESKISNCRTRRILILGCIRSRVLEVFFCLSLNGFEPRVCCLADAWLGAEITTANRTVCMVSHTYVKKTHPSRLRRLHMKLKMNHHSQEIGCRPH